MSDNFLLKQNSGLDRAIESILIGQLKAIVEKRFDNKDYRSRIFQFIEAHKESPFSLLVPDLQGYADSMSLNGQAVSTVRNHISTVRLVYQELLKDRPFLFKIVRAGTWVGTDQDIIGADEDIAKHKPLVDELAVRISNSLDVRIKTQVVQDKADSEIGVRLEAEELGRFLALPNKFKHSNPKRYYRDKAMFLLMACTGIRESEVVKLTIADLFETFGGHAALKISKGKGNKQRMIPYGDNNPLPVILEWLEESGIDDIKAQGKLPVFVPITKGGKVSDTTNSMTTRTIQRIFKMYSDDYGQTIRPHDLRRTYAFLLWKAGVDLVMIKSNLGHRQLETTLEYIGNINAAHRLAPKIFEIGE